jgi:hypothetical protein
VVDVRAVGVALAIGEGVVLAVVCDPRDDGTLDRGRAEHGEDESNGGVCLERSVGKEAMEADCDAEPGEEVHDREHEHVVAVKQAVPQLPAGEAECDDGANGDEPREKAVEVLVRDGLDVLGRGTVGCGTLDLGVVRIRPGGCGALDRMGAHRCARRWTVAGRDDVKRHCATCQYPFNTMQDTGWRANAPRED